MTEQQIAMAICILLWSLGIFAVYYFVKISNEYNDKTLSESEIMADYLKTTNTARSFRDERIKDSSS